MTTRKAYVKPDFSVRRMSKLDGLLPQQKSRDFNYYLYHWVI